MKERLNIGEYAYDYHFCCLTSIKQECNNTWLGIMLVTKLGYGSELEGWGEAGLRERVEICAMSIAPQSMLSSRPCLLPE